MSIENEFLAEESGVDYDAYMADNLDMNLHECLSCGSTVPLDEFKELGYDGNIWGTCPICGNYSIIIPVENKE